MRTTTVRVIGITGVLVDAATVPHTADQRALALALRRVLAVALVQPARPRALAVVPRKDGIGRRRLAATIYRGTKQSFSYRFHPDIRKGRLFFDSIKLTSLTRTVERAGTINYKVCVPVLLHTIQQPPVYMCTFLV